MGETITLTNPRDQQHFDAWRCVPTDARRGGLIILHALWGVTPHLRELAQSFADDGYEVLVPNLFSRSDPAFPEVDLDPARQAIQVSYAARAGWGRKCLTDIQATIDALQGPVFVMGFSFGGTAAWLAAAWCHPIAAVACYYGGHIIQNIGDTPRVPTILHFGKQDRLIPAADIEAITAAHPDIPAYLYDAGHAFVAPSGCHEDSARLSRLRTLQLFARQVGKGEN